MSKKSFIDSVQVGAPCSENWEEMAGNDRVRFCSHCAKDVNDLSTMTRKEATRFVRASDGKICIRYRVDPVTRRPMFAEQLLQITRRAPRLAAGALTASMAVSTAAYAQEGSPNSVPTPPVVEQVLGGRSANGTITTQQINDLPVTDGPTFTGGVIAAVEYRSPLSQAVADDDKVLVRELLNKGEKVNAREDSYSKITPMFLAVETGDLELIQMLLDAGAKVNVRSESKETPLMRLDQDATPELVDLLIRYRAKVNAADENGNTALIHAVEYSTPEAAQALIAAGADVNAANSDGETALMKAADRGDIDTLRALIAAGAWLNARDKDGDNAWVYADNREIEDLLISFGIEITPEQRAKHDGTSPEDTLAADPAPTPSPAP